MQTANEPLGDFVKRQWFWVASICVGSGLAHIGTSTMPFQIGALMDGGGRSSSQAGLFGFAEVGALAVGMILIAPWIDRVHPRTIGIASAVLTGVANLALFSIHSFSAQLFCGAAAGLGFGFVFAATIAGAAAANQPDRLYAVGNGGALLLIMGVISSLPLVATHFGPMAIFVGIAGLAFASVTCLFGFRRGSRDNKGDETAWPVPGALGLLFSWAVFSTGTGAIYAFSERIGRSLNIAPQTIGVVLSAGVFIGVLGTIAAALSSGRVQRRHALLGGMAGSALSCLLLGYSSGLGVFVAGVFAYWISYMFLYSYLLGTAALLDGAGRIGTLGGGLERLGYGTGAWLGGIIAEHGGYSVIGALGFTGCVLGVLIGFPSLFRALAATARAGAPVLTSIRDDDSRCPRQR